MHGSTIAVVAYSVFYFTYSGGSHFIYTLTLEGFFPNFSSFNAFFEVFSTKQCDIASLKGVEGLSLDKSCQNVS